MTFRHKEPIDSEEDVKLLSPPRELLREVGVVEKTVYPNHAMGIVKIKTRKWGATSYKKNQIIHKGEKVKVVDLDKFNLVVERLK